MCRAGFRVGRLEPARHPAPRKKSGVRRCRSFRFRRDRKRRLIGRGPPEFITRQKVHYVLTTGLTRAFGRFAGEQKVAAQAMRARRSGSRPRQFDGVSWRCSRTLIKVRKAPLHPPENVSTVTDFARFHGFSAEGVGSFQRGGLLPSLSLCG
jgi:hypothetical protein